MILKSIQNNNISLPDGEKESFNSSDIFEHLWKLRHKDNSFLKFPFHSFFDDINTKIPQLDKAIELAAEMILNHKIIGIIGDYDVDGTISTAILVKFFSYLKSHIEFDYTYHIPNRFAEGYGPSIFAVNLLKDKNVELLITVDSGSTSYNELDLANTLNMKSIVLDHHIVQKIVPEATCFVNCQNSEEFKYLCGGGLAFVFIIQLQKYLQSKIIFPDFDFRYVIDLAAIATICDFVPLVNLNRTIVHYGLKLLNYQYLNTELKLNKAIHMILQYSMYNYNKNTYMSSTDVGFAIGPYLNVAGRLKDANVIVEFLTCEDEKQLELHFFQIQSLWRERKKIQEDILNTLDVNENDKFIFVYGDNIHEGIMGIVASKLKDKYNKPAIVISINGKEGKGSIRSIFPFNAGNLVALAIENNILTKGGGHKAAAGFSIEISKIQEFYEYTKAYMQPINIDEVRNITVDSILSLQGLDKDFYEKMQSIGPFGIQNEDFMFLFPHLIIKSIYIMQSKHISMNLTNITKTYSIKSIWFFVPIEAFELLIIGKIIDVVGNIKYINNKIELYITDIVITNEENKIPELVLV